MQLHEEIIKAAAKLCPVDAISILRKAVECHSERSLLEWPYNYITSIWEESLVAIGEKKEIYRVFIRHECSDKLSRVGWMMEAGIEHCVICNSPFGILNSRSHCRACGNLICQRCKSQAYIEYLEVHDMMTVCNNCCYGQVTVSIAATPLGSEFPIVIMDLPSASTYPLISVEPGYVLVSYLEDSTIPVFINVTFSGRVPHLKRAGLVSFSLLRRVTQQTAFEAFDAIFSSSQLDREGCTNITFDSSIHNQIIMCIGRFHVLQLSTACEVLDMVTYFDPHCSIEVNFNRCGFHQAVYSPCPPIDLFERYIQVPVTTDKDDLVQLVSSSHPAHHTQSPPPLSIQFPDQSGGDQRVLDPTTIELLSSKTMHSSESGNVGNATGPLKLAKSRLGGQDESFIDALVDSLMSKSSPAQFPHNNTSSGVRMTDHHRTQSDPPHMKLGGHEGSAMLTADMMEVSREACASTAEISALLSQARRHPRALIGWQIMLLEPGAKELIGVFVVTAIRHGGLAIWRVDHRLSSLSDRDRWVHLSYTERSREHGFPFHPLRKVF